MQVAPLLRPKASKAISRNNTKRLVFYIAAEAFLVPTEDRAIFRTGG